MPPVHPEPYDLARQRRIHDAIATVGGYWRPIAGVARLLEELGELAELLLTECQSSSTEHILEELADIWIISTCTANQFNAQLTRPATIVHDSVAAAFLEATRFSGRLSRIVNYYDGPKTPRSFNEWPRIEPTISGLHQCIEELATRFHGDIRSTVDEKVGRLEALDRGRYALSYDPTMSPVLTSFAAVQASALCPFASSASLYGGPTFPSSGDTREFCQSAKASLTTFAKAAPYEDLDGYVIELPTTASVDFPTLAKSFAELLHHLSAVSGSALDKTLVPKPGWQFCFHKQPMFVSVFSGLYPAPHVRHAPNGTFVVLQPACSFDRFQVGSAYPASNQIKKQIRARYIASGVDYPSSIIDSRVEAEIYLLPLPGSSPLLKWWDFLP